MTRTHLLIALTADHGESLTEHGIYFGHHGLYDELIHVPLILYYPAEIPARRIEATVQHIDLMQTILDLARIEYDHESLDGRSLLPLLKSDNRNEFRDFVYVEEAKCQREFAIRTADFKYIFAPSKQDAMCSYCGKIHGGIEELYDLRLDPGELRNIADEQPEIRVKLKEMLERHILAIENSRNKSQLRNIIPHLKVAGRI